MKKQYYSSWILFFSIGSIFCSSFSGCSTIKLLKKGRLFKKIYTHLERGMTKKDVLLLKGKPYKEQQYNDPSNRKMEVLIYRIKKKDNKKKKSRRKRLLTRILLREGIVIGWGEISGPKIKRKIEKKKKVLEKTEEAVVEEEKTEEVVETFDDNSEKKAIAEGTEESKDNE